MNKFENHDELVKEFTDILVNFKKNLSIHQIDVYLYVSTEKRTAQLKLFDNADGESGLNDNHFVIYQQAAANATWLDWILQHEDFLEILGFSKEDFEQEVIKFLLDKKKLTESESVNYKPYYKDDFSYINSRCDYADKLHKVYDNIVEGQRDGIAAYADNIISEWGRSLFGE